MNFTELHHQVRRCAMDMRASEPPEGGALVESERQALRCFARHLRQVDGLIARLEPIVESSYWTRAAESRREC